MVPHLVYFVDLAVRGRGLDPRVGALTWLLFGIGAIVGTLTGGRAADRWGAAGMLKIWLAFQAAAIALALRSAASRASASVPLHSRAPANSQARQRAWCGCARPPFTPWRKPPPDSCWCRCSHTPARMSRCSSPALRYPSQRCWSRFPIDRRSSSRSSRVSCGLPACGRSAGSERRLLRSAIKRAVTRCSAMLRPPHDLQYSIRSLTARRRLARRLHCGHCVTEPSCSCPMGAMSAP
jgi:uncharacterized MFS-type transporter YbfB